MLHFFYRFFILMLVQTVKSPVFIHPCMKKILIDRSQFVLELTVQPLNDVGAAFHVMPPRLILAAYDREQLSRMALCQSLLHQCFLQHLLCVACAHPALRTYTKAGLQVPHPVRTTVNSFTNRSVSYTFANTNIHDERLKSTTCYYRLPL